MSNFLKRTKRASEENDYDKIHSINPQKEKESQYWYQRELIEKLQLQLAEKEKERLILAQHLITIINLKEQATSTQELFPVLQAINKASEYLK